jgi:hypothetical protein
MLECVNGNVDVGADDERAEPNSGEVYCDD